MLHYMSAPAAIPFWLGLKPRLAEDADFELLRAFLQGSGFNYENINRRLGVAHTFEYRLPKPEILFAQSIEDAFGFLVAFFVQGIRLPAAAMARLVPADVRGTMERLFLFDADQDHPGHVYSTCCIYGFPGGILIASDRCASPGGENHSSWPADVLYPPLFENTLNFVRRLPVRPCEAMLDIGTGTGIAALASAGCARQIWASDITPRAVEFAEFNRRLNGAHNMTVVEGDLYEPVTGLSFDRITVHPPYVPGASARYVYREGGEDGEQIFRRCVEGLPTYLRPGGRFYSMLLGSDRDEETFEIRIRKWLGPSANEFDVLIAFEAVKTTAEFLASNTSGSDSEKEAWQKTWRNNGTTALVYGSVVIQRRRSPRPAASARIQTGAGLGGQALDLLVDWSSAGSQAALNEMVLNARPAMMSGVEMTVTHRMRDGRLVPEDYEFKIPGAFRTQGKTPEWMAQTIAACDGTVSWREHFERLLRAGKIPPHAKPEEFARMLHPLVASGVVTV